MSNNLKHALRKKLEQPSSADFDSRFFEKLEHQKNRPGVFASWITWVISGCATLSVVFFAATNYSPFMVSRSFDHREYVESALEIQSAVTDDIVSDDMIDLTSSSVDEI